MQILRPIEPEPLGEGQDICSYKASQVSLRPLAQAGLQNDTLDLLPGQENYSRVTLEAM